MTKRHAASRVNLLNARDRLGETIIEIVAADGAAHGEEVIVALRKQNPAAYARLISDLVHFKKFATERAPAKSCIVSAIL